jgi:hypothetical protein
MSIALARSVTTFVLLDLVQSVVERPFTRTEWLAIDSTRYNGPVAQCPLGRKTLI